MKKVFHDLMRMFFIVWAIAFLFFIAVLPIALSVNKQNGYWSLLLLITWPIGLYLADELGKVILKK